jgi:hypothetical protein
MASEIAARQGSGVRARWVELPDCSWRNVTPGDGSFIPLLEDLSNSIIATCKHWNWTDGGTPWTPPDRANASVGDPIYDPVINAHAIVIPTAEHQVRMHKEGDVETPPLPGADPNEPTTDLWNVTGKKNVITGQAQWEPFDDSQIVQIFADPEYPEDVSVIMFEKKDKKTWVELPDCTGADTDKVLAADLVNASVATCKPRPGGKKDGAAQDALKSLTPGGGK